MGIYVKKDEKKQKKKKVLLIVLLLLMCFLLMLFFVGKSWVKPRDDLEDITFGIKDTNQEDPNLDKSDNSYINEPIKKEDPAYVDNKTSDIEKPTKLPSEEDKNVTVKGEDRIIVTSEGEKWKKNKYLNIFYNSVYNSNKIAPGVSGLYNFSIENRLSKNYLYDIEFEEDNEHGINLMYRLKRNGYYVVGNSETWVKTDKIYLKNILLESELSDVYTLEWFWVDSNNDSAVGKIENAEYKLKISITYEERV
jgi:hypothetical protein